MPMIPNRPAGPPPCYRPKLFGVDVGDRKILMDGVRKLSTERLQGIIAAVVKMQSAGYCAEVIRADRRIHGLTPEQLREAANIVGSAAARVLNERRP